MTIYEPRLAVEPKNINGEWVNVTNDEIFLTYKESLMEGVATILEGCAKEEQPFDKLRGFYVAKITTETLFPNYPEMREAIDRVLLQ